MVEQRVGALLASEDVLGDAQGGVATRLLDEHLSHAAAHDAVDDAPRSRVTGGGIDHVGVVRVIGDGVVLGLQWHHRSFPSRND